MPITESQLQVWSNPGATTTAKRTHESVRSVIEGADQLSHRDVETFLQGSYRNDTNIRGDSDVDIVAQLKQTFRYDADALSASEEAALRATYPDATYNWTDFRADVVDALRSHYGPSGVVERNKCIEIAGGSGRLTADLLVCLSYRRYTSFHTHGNETFDEGVHFWTQNDGREIVNYPKSHYSNGVSKNTITTGRYKPTVRMFKNAREHLVDHGIISPRLAPSYFLECLIFNAESAAFGSSLRNTYVGVLDSLASKDLGSMMCQNGIVPLFGSTPEQWNTADAVAFIGALAQLWVDS